MQDNKGSNDPLRRGIIVFVGLTVLTGLEYLIAIGNFPTAVVLLVIIMVAKAALIIEYFMHLRVVFQSDEEEGDH